MENGDWVDNVSLPIRNKSHISDSSEFDDTRGNFLRQWLVFMNTGSSTETSRLLMNRSINVPFMFCSWTIFKELLLFREQIFS